MRKLCSLLAIGIIFLVPAFSQNPVTQGPTKVIGNFTLLPIPINTLPSAASSPNALRTVDDGTSSTDCTTGGGGNTHLCYSNGTDWIVLGSGSGVASVGGSNTQVQFNNNGVLGGSAAVLDAAGNLSTPGSVVAEQGIVNGPLTAKQFAGQPMCDMYSSINACIQSLPSVGGRALSWGLTGAHSLSTGLFDSVTALGGNLELGAEQITASVQQNLPNSWMLSGINRGGTTRNTDLLEDTTFQTACQISAITDSGSTHTIATTATCAVRQGEAFSLKGTGTNCDHGAFVNTLVDSTHFTFLDSYSGACAETGLGYVRRPFINLGNSSFSFGTFVKDLSIDCQSVPGSIGLYSDNIQELSGLDRVSIRNCEIPVLFEKGAAPDGSGVSVANIDLSRLEITNPGAPTTQNQDLSGVSVSVTGDGTAMSTATVDLSILLPGGAATPGQWAIAYPGDVITLINCTGDTGSYFNHIPWMITKVITSTTTQLQFSTPPASTGESLTGCTLSHGVGVFFKNGGSFQRGISNMTIDAGTSSAVTTTGPWVSPGHIAVGLLSDTDGSYDKIHVEFAQAGYACGVTTQCVHQTIGLFDGIGMDSGLVFPDLILPVGGTPIELQPQYVVVDKVTAYSSTCVLYDPKHGGCLSTHNNGWQGGPWAIGYAPSVGVPSQVQMLADQVWRKDSDTSLIAQDKTGTETGRLRFNKTTKSAILSSNGGTTYIRPNGDQSTVGQVSVDTAGNTTATQFIGPLNGTSTNVTGVVAVAHGGTNHTISGLLCQSGAQGSIQGTGATQTVYSCTIPAGALGVGECGRVEVYFAHSTGSASVVYQWVYGGTVMTFGGSPSASNYMKAQILICNGAGVQNAQQLIPDQILSGTGIAAVLAPATAAENTVNATTLNFTFNVANTDAVTPKYLIGYRVPGY